MNVTSSLLSSQQNFTAFETTLESVWYVGVSAVDITPPVGMWLAGYAMRDRPAESTIHNLWVKAVVLQDKEGNKGVIVGSDILGFTRELSERIKQRISKDLNIPPESVLLNSSHTHSGPVIENSLMPIYPIEGTDQIEKVKKYTTDLEEKVFQVVKNAVNNIKPAQVYYGKGLVRFAVNRRNNRESEIENQFEFRGPVDYSVPVFVAKLLEDDTITAIIFGYACHATVLSGYQWCGDYPGFAQEELQNKFPTAVAVFMAGCGADINPLPRRRVSLARQYGKELASAVEGVMEEGLEVLPSKLITRLKRITLELETPKSKEELEQIANDPNQLDYMRRSAIYLLRDLANGIPLRTSYDYPVQVWSVGGTPLIALAGEVVVDYAIYVKQRLGKNVVVLGYSNELMSYIPSVRVLREGGYEGDTSQLEYGMPAKWKESIEERILSAVESLWNEIQR
ncbi:MAG: neutral/alkaline non-lysosomal ceramidase N-terminal domain-containing protein [Candidatus Hydrogenedentes bacterium]|nr:neutral/alkaline non-lysosomal ceramidase N-terminal domain-containing protein [Candidatus Hydrogenedentota bacterium]